MRKRICIIGSKDRISRLPTELIHEILSFLDTRTAVQTCILSLRWKRIWTTLPFLKFNGYDQHFSNRESRFSRFLDHFLSSRNHRSQILKLELYVKQGISPKLIKDYVEYAISRNVQDLSVDLCYHYQLSIFRSSHLKKLKLLMRYASDGILESDCFRDLPALTTLHLIRPRNMQVNCKVREACLICLPSLTTLCLDGCDLPESLSLHTLTTLRLERCNMTKTVWDFPALLCLELDDVVFPKCLNTFFSGLVKLTSLTLFFRKKNVQDYYISCPQLLNLELKSCTTTTNPLTGNIVVLAPNLRNFTSVGIFSVTCGVSVLENVNIKLQGCFKDYSVLPAEKLEEYYSRFIFMFPGLSSAKILSLDFETIEALSAISEFLAHFSSPFNNLKYVKLPRGYEKSSLCSTIKSYLLAGSPRATIVTTLPQNIVIPQMAPVSPTSQNIILKDPSVSPTKEQYHPQGIHRKVHIDTVEFRVEEEHILKNSWVDANGLIEFGALDQGFGGPVPNSQVAEARNDWRSSSRENSVFGLWQGHKVILEFVSLLDLIVEKYPETFERFTTKSKTFCTMKLNMLCTSVNAFVKTSMAEVDAEVIAEYRDLFADLQRSFNVKWLVNRLNYIEQLLFSQHELHEIDSRIDDAKSKLHALQTHIDDTRCKLRDLQTLRAEKMTKLEKAFGTMGSNLAVGYIGDALLLPAP